MPNLVLVPQSEVLCVLAAPLCGDVATMWYVGMCELHARFIYLCWGSFTLSTYTHRIITKVYIATNNIHVEIIRFRKN